MNMNSTSEQQFLNRATEIIEANLQNGQFGVSELAGEMGMSRTSLHRKIKAIANKSVSQFICQVRLKKALELLKQNSATVSETAYECGFHSVTYFTKCFHDFYGYTPGEAGNRNDFESEAENDKTPKPANRKKRLITILVSAVVVVVLASIPVIIFKPFSSKENTVSIAVLPFKDDSPEEGNSYIINGLMDEILDKLQIIKVFQVKSRTDSEKYRDTKKSSTEIAKELNVNYILEGSGQKLQDNIKLRIQLIDAKTGIHIWSRTYNKKMDDIFALQEEVALSVASELKTEITGEEEQQIKKLPTANMVAYQLYLKGNDFLDMNFFNPNWANIKRKEYVHQAKHFFQLAVNEDSTFSEAYEKLAFIYLSLFTSTSNIELLNTYLDTGFVMAEKAVESDPNNADAYSRKSGYCFLKGDWENAYSYFLKALDLYKLTKDDWEYHQSYFWHYYNIEDYYSSLKSYYKYRELKPANLLTDANFLRFVIRALFKSGYPQPAKKIALDILNQTKDSITYYDVLNEIEEFSGNSAEALKNTEKIKNIDSTQSWFYYRFALVDNIMNRNISEAYNILQKIENSVKSGDTLLPKLEYGYVYLKNNLKIKADYHFEGHKKRLEKEIFYNQLHAQRYQSHFYLAAIYSATGNKKEAISYLEQIKNRKTDSFWYMWYLKNWPLFDNIRNEPEFAVVLKDVETKYQKEHVRVGKLLREFGEIE